MIPALLPQAEDQRNEEQGDPDDPGREPDVSAEGNKLFPGEVVTVAPDEGRGIADIDHPDHKNSDQQASEKDGYRKGFLSLHIT